MKGLFYKGHGPMKGLFYSVLLYVGETSISVWVPILQDFTDSSLVMTAVYFKSHFSQISHGNLYAHNVKGTKAILWTMKA